MSTHAQLIIISDHVVRERVSAYYYYSGGSTEMSLTAETTATVEDDRPGEGESDNPDSDLTISLGSSLLTGEEWSSGTTLPLNSKRLNLNKWQTIAVLLELSTDATLAETRLIVDGKLTELGYEPVGVQVVLSDSEESVLYLVDEGGIIKKIDMTAHVTNTDARESGTSERSALRDTSELERLCQLVSEHELVIENLQGELQTATETISELQIASANAERLTGEVASLKASVQAEKLKAKRFWRLHCEQMLREEDLLQAKETEIAELREQLNIQETSPRSTSNARTLETSPTRSATIGHECETTIHPTPSVRRGKAPPVKAFTGDEATVHWDDWLPTLERAATWNNWSEQEKLIQLAGHLRGKAQREWDLMAENSKASFGAAVKALRARLDSGSRAVAAQDFRHLSQQTTESAADFICRLEKTFRRAYGHEQMSEETRNTLLYSQLNEGLKYSLIKAPAVSGASEYQQLCVAARNEERRQSELVKRQQYQQADHRLGRQDRLERSSRKPTGNDNKDKTEDSPSSGRGPSNQRYQIKCWNCKKAGHQAKDCRLPKRESTGNSRSAPGTKMVQSDAKDDPLKYLLFGMDCRSPTEATLLPTEPIEYTDVEEYREEVTLSLSLARELAASNIKTAQKRYKEQYDKRATPVSFKAGDLVLVRFPQEESGKNRKLSRPWHGPYRVIQCVDPDVSVVKQYFPEEGSIQVHQLRVRPCPQLPTGYYWYGGKRHSSGKVPGWVDKLLSAGSSNDSYDRRMEDAVDTRGDNEEQKDDNDDNEEKDDPVRDELLYEGGSDVT